MKPPTQSTDICICHSTSLPVDADIDQNHLEIPPNLPLSIVKSTPTPDTIKSSKTSQTLSSPHAARSMIHYLPSPEAAEFEPTS